MAEVKEYLLTTDEFKNPKVIDNATAIGVLITRLLLMNPGTNPLHPDMGVGIGGEKYRYILESEMYQLQNRTEEQMRTYLPSRFLSDSNVIFNINSNKYLVITISVDGTSYVYDTEESDTPIELSDII